MIIDISMTLNENIFNCKVLYLIEGYNFHIIRCIHTSDDLTMVNVNVEEYARLILVDKLQNGCLGEMQMPNGLVMR